MSLYPPVSSGDNVLLGEVPVEFSLFFQLSLPQTTSLSHKKILFVPEKLR